MKSSSVFLNHGGAFYVPVVKYNVSDSASNWLLRVGLATASIAIKSQESPYINVPFTFPQQFDIPSEISHMFRQGWLDL
jgi:hypothetical protein